MKKVVVSVILLMCVLFTPATVGASGDNSGVKIPSKTIVLYPPKPSGRPNAPSRVFIECTYGVGFIDFRFPENIQGATVEVFNGEESLSEFVTRSFPHMELPDLSGSYNIVCTTEDNQVFQGTLIF